MNSKENITEKDILTMKLFVIICKVGCRTFAIILRELYKVHPYSKNGTLSAKDFFTNLNCPIKVLGNLSRSKILKLGDGYKFDFKDKSSIELDTSTLYLIIFEMFSNRRSELTLRKNREKLKKGGELLNKNGIEDIDKQLSGIESLGKFQTKYICVFELVKTLKDIRNQLCHELFSDVKDVNGAKDLFEDSLTNLFREMTSLFEKNFNNDLNEALAELTKIWNQPLISKGSLSNMEDEVFQFIKDSKEELKRKYERFSVLLPSFLIHNEFIDLKVDDIFTPVYLYSKRKILNYDEILTYSTKKDASPSAVVISGNAGLGKTTVCRKLTSDWCQDKVSMSKTLNISYDLLLHIEAKKTKQKSLVEYLNSILLPETYGKYKYKKDDIIFYLAQCSILFIIDGYDEKSDSASYLLNEIMTYFPDKKFLISTRPYYTKDIFNSLKQNNILYLDLIISGFNDQNMIEFTEKVWGEIKKNNIECDKSDSFLKFLKGEIGGDVKELLTIPLTLLIIIYLYVYGKQKFEPIRNITFTKLYKLIFLHIKNGIINKLKVQVDENINDLDNLIFDIAGECFRLTIIDKVASVDREMVKNIKAKIKEYKLFTPELMDAIFRSFFLFNPSLQKPTVAKMSNDEQLAENLEFLHKTQFEYLTALYLVNESNWSNKDNLLTQIFNENSCRSKENIETIFGVVTFMIGILVDDISLNTVNNSTTKKSYFTIIMNFIRCLLRDNKEKFVMCWKILYETNRLVEIGEYTFDSNVAVELISMLPQQRWELYNHEVVSGLKLLSYTDIKIDELTVKIDEGICANEMTHLLSAFKALKFRKTQQSLILKLHLLSDLNKGINPNDNILNSVHSSIHLKEFTGVIGEDVCNLLKVCGKLKIMHVRFQSKKAQNMCIKALNGIKSLKRFYLYIFIDQDDVNHDYEPLCLNKLLDRNIRFVGVVKENINWVARALEKLRPSDQLFDTVTLLRTSLELSDIKELLSVITTHVRKKFTVQSTNDISEEENLKINNTLHHCEFDWSS